MRLLLFLLLSLALAWTALADGPADNLPDNVRPVPRPGIPVPEADRALLQQELAGLGRAIEGLQGNPKAAPLLPDVQIFHVAVRVALEHNEFFAPADIARAKSLLAVGQERARQLAQGQSPWLWKPGPTARGYVSEIDGSVQPYGLYIPESFSPTGGHRWRLDTWFHGRGETLSEVNFLDGVLRSGGPFVRPDTFVLQPYGRYCNANKLAGETDLFEALDDVRKTYRIDDQRIVVRGFSMGGAACWQFAAHHAWRWAAAAPGAGFSETAEFLNVFQNERVAPTWWERRLWQLYDCPAYAANFANLPVVAYSGERDRQIQAARVMEKALLEQGISLVHVIGPGTEHSYHPDAVREINRRIDSIAERGRIRAPLRVRLQTPTLKYNRQFWVVVDGLEEHWKPARVDAQILDAQSVLVNTENVSALSLTFEPGHCPLDVDGKPTLEIDRQKLSVPAPLSDRSWQMSLTRTGGRWAVGGIPEGELRKRHDLQGPIDDAFTGGFLIVRPTGTPRAPGAAAWVTREMNRAIREWRRHFRGEPRVKDDRDVTPDDVARFHLVLWGDPGSNSLLARMGDRLPVQWTAESVSIGGSSGPASSTAPVLIYPNPLNPRRYVVLNSGFTWREYDYLNNARQVPKLPDWALVDLTTPPGSRWPGRIAAAGFFDEQWRYVTPPAVDAGTAGAGQ